MTIEEASQQPVSIIISCLYEEDTIAECITRVSKAMPNAEILIVHGGDDGTLEVAKKMAESNPRIKPYKNENDEGKGHAIQVGIELASHDIMCQFDADLQFDPEENKFMREHNRVFPCCRRNEKRIFKFLYSVPVAL